jgi:hypothetical protein
VEDDGKEGEVEEGVGMVRASGEAEKLSTRTKDFLSSVLASGFETIGGSTLMEGASGEVEKFPTRAQDFLSSEGMLEREGRGGFLPSIADGF